MTRGKTVFCCITPGSSNAAEHGVHYLIGRIPVLEQIEYALGHALERGPEDYRDDHDDSYPDKEPDEPSSGVIAAADVTASERPYELADKSDQRYPFEELAEHPSAGAVRLRALVRHLGGLPDRLRLVILYLSLSVALLRRLGTRVLLYLRLDRLLYRRLRRLRLRTRLQLRSL